MIHATDFLDTFSFASMLRREKRQPKRHYSLIVLSRVSCLSFSENDTNLP